MKFGPVPLGEAEGAILAHSLALPDGRLRKGRVLEPADIARLAADGRTEVIAARLEPGDLDEDTAADRLASALIQGPGLRATRASTGRVNIYAEAPGILEIDTEAVAALNRIHPMITLATLPPMARVAARTLSGTVKIISYGVPEAALTVAAQAAHGALHHLPVLIPDATLIQTDVGEGPGKGERAIAQRLAALGMTLAESRLVPHATRPLAEAIRAAKTGLILILTASATSDPADVAPEALRAAGGTVTRFGMPVDPGNLLFLGALGARPVIGLPGCARSPALNGADWVLERTVCGRPPTDDDIAAMGLGGLLKESPARPHPREAKA